MHTTEADICSVHLLTESDHNIMTCTINTKFISAHPRIPNYIFNNRIYDFKRTSNKQWERFSQELDKDISIKLPVLQTTTINNRWNKVKDLILESANKYLKKHKNAHKGKKIRALSTNPTLQILTNLQKLTNWGRKFFVQNKRTNFIRLAIFKCINQININNETHIDSSPWDDIYVIFPPLQAYTWLAAVKNTWHLTKKTLSQTINNNQKNTIKKLIINRQQALETNKKKIINSILGTERNNIIIDKLIVHDPESRLILNEAEINQTIQEHFENWTRKRRITQLTSFLL